MTDVDQESAEMGMLIGADATRNSIAIHIEERADAMPVGATAAWLRELAAAIRRGEL